MQAWRISQFADLSGKGGEIAAFRWNHRGDRIVYCSEHPALALLEILVNVDPEDLSDSYRLLTINVDDTVAIETPDLPENWREDQLITRAFWHDFITENRAPLLRVPSIIMPHAFNILVNPAHPDHARLSIASVEDFALDQRFVG